MKFKIRASALGQIMTNDRSGKAMGKTAQAYCEQWLKEKLYDRKKQITTKYMDKGLIMEDEAIDFYAKMTDSGFLLKNEQFFKNEYMTGTPDLILPDKVVDIKSSWDCFTFPLFDSQIENKDYYWQLQAYMILTGKTSAELAYILMDTPEHLIKKEAYYHAINIGYDLDQVIKDFKARMTYFDVPNNLRIKCFTLPKDDVEGQIIARVQECRNYINSLI